MSKDPYDAAYMEYIRLLKENDRPVTEASIAREFEKSEHEVGVELQRLRDVDLIEKSNGVWDYTAEGNAFMA